MKSNFDKSLSAVLVHEGGYVNHPRDPGGATNKGVTQAVYDGYRSRRGLERQTVKMISNGEVGDIYKYQYWDAVRGDELPSGVDYCVFDFAVNSGVSRAAKYLQAAVGVKQDGKIGFATLDAVNTASASGTITAICDARIAFLKNLGTWDTFGRGWAARVAGVRKLALSMATGDQSKPVEAQTPQPAPIPAPGKVDAPTPVSEPTKEPKGILFALLALLKAIFSRKV